MTNAEPNHPDSRLAAKNVRRMIGGIAFGVSLSAGNISRTALAAVSYGA